MISKTIGYNGLHNIFRHTHLAARKSSALLIEDGTYKSNASSSWWIPSTMVQWSSKTTTILLLWPDKMVVFKNQNRWGLIWNMDSKRSCYHQISSFNRSSTHPVHFWAVSFLFFGLACYCSHILASLLIRARWFLPVVSWFLNIIK